MTPPDGGWEMRHIPYTLEGSIESASKFGRPGGSPQRRRQIRRLVVLFILSPFAIVALAVIVSLLSR